MKKFLILLATMALISIAVQAQAPAPAKADEAAPTIDQILDKYVAALGGKAAIEKVSSRITTGTMDIPVANISGSFKTQSKAPNMSSLSADLPGFGVLTQGFDGSVAWENNPIQGLRERTGAELADTKLDAEFYRDLKLKQLYPKMELSGKEKVGERTAYLVIATPAEGSTEKFYFDVESGLLIRQDSERESPEGKVPVQIFVEDYRDVDGIKIPFRIRQVLPQFEMMLKISEVKHDGPVDDAAFKKPSGN